MSDHHDERADAARLTGTLEVALERLEQARPFAKQRYQHPVLDVLGRLMRSCRSGIEAILERAPRLDAAGLFAGSDWDTPEALLPQLVGSTLAEPGPADWQRWKRTSLLRLLACRRRAKAAASHAAAGIMRGTS